MAIWPEHEPDPHRDCAPPCPGCGAEAMCRCPGDDEILDSPNSLAVTLAELRARGWRRINNPRRAA